MDIQEYRIFEIFTLILPLLILFFTSLLAYVKMKHKYIQLKAKYEPDYRKTKDYGRYVAFKHFENEIMRPFVVRENDTWQDED